jgi:TM2 domain-containing membrane protein YozV
MVCRKKINIREQNSMAGQGSSGNVIAALASFFIPGLGQLLQGRVGIAILQFVLAAILWFLLLGWIIHLWSIIDAAKWTPK